MSLTRHWRILIALSAALVAVAFAAPRLMRAPDIRENRVLADLPAPPAGLGDLDRYRKGLDAYVADRFPARPHLIALANLIRLRLGASGSERVIVGRQGWLFYDDGTHLGVARGRPALTREEARAWLEGLAGRTEALKTRGIAYVVISAPLKETIYPQYAPAWFEGPSDARAAVRLSGWAGTSGAGEALYLHEALAQPTRWGLKTFSRHDTHWTGIGAHLGYMALMGRLNALGLTDPPRPLERFEEVSPAVPPRDLALMIGVASFVAADYPEFMPPAAEPALRTTYLTGRTDWTAPRVMDTGMAGKPVALITGDSFSNAMMPFLYGHFSRLIFAHNQDGTWREDLIDRFKPDVVILEVVESGLPAVMLPAPPASAEARARIERAMMRLPPAPRRVGPVVAHNVVGSDGGDRLKGGPAADFVYGRAGEDEIDAGAGDDHVQGGRGADRIDGGPGADWLSGDLDDDLLTGGPGADVFRLGAGGGGDRITDFNAEEGDRVELDPGVAWRVEQAGPDAVVIGGAGERIVLQGVRAETLGADTIFTQ